VLEGLINQQTKDLATIHGVAGVACNAVSTAEEHSASTEVEERLHAMPTRVASVISDGIWVGATRAPATA